MAAVGFPMLVATHVFLILPLCLSSGLPEYGATDFDRFLDPVGRALTTAHDVRVRHFGLERLHLCLVRGQCPLVSAAAAGMAGGRKWHQRAVTYAIRNKEATVDRPRLVSSKLGKCPVQNVDRISRHCAA